MEGKARRSSAGRHQLGHAAQDTVICRTPWQNLLEVDLLELEGPAEPEMLRKALIGRLEGLEPDLVPAADVLAMDDLIGLVRGSIRERIAQIKKGQYPVRKRD